MVFAARSALKRNRRDAALGAHPTLTATADAMSPNAQIPVVQVLAPQVEPAMKLLKAVWVAWREVMWGVQGEAPRVLGDVGSGYARATGDNARPSHRKHPGS
ncbi:hypothetical protein ASE31_21290 [Acidovorax sp. Root217]|nr:hypothetical protein ASE31_21290 [Acidovorax sp. Root217]